MQMQVVAVKEGSYTRKDGTRFTSYKGTFITPDGDSFTVNTDKPMRGGDTVLFGVRCVLDSNGYTVAALKILEVLPATSSYVGVPE